ncbi:MAG: CDP-alcohol phosphatidyltransferase family protein [Blautia sp.]|nr:CDP-alcohol phosphatidyltransferase family protein [Blautia sp.]
MLGFYDYTVVLTYVSLMISIYGMTHAMQGNFRRAILCLAISGLCDMFDGKIARTKKDRTEDEKSFGIQIDSLCDVVCFGVFPIVISYCMGMHGPIGVAILCFYGAASVIRLGYFNVMEAKRQAGEEGPRKYYQGLPITSMAIVLPFMYLFRNVGRHGFVLILHIVVLIVGILFISNIKIKKPQNPGVILIVAVIALLLAHMFHLL